MKQSISFSFFFPSSIQNFFYGFVLWVLLPKKAKDEVLLLPTFRFYNTNTIIAYTQAAGACACVFLFGGELEGLLRVNHEIYENLGLKFLTNILQPSQRIIPVITWYSGKGKGPTPHTPHPIYIYIYIVIHKKVFFLIFNFFILLLLLLLYYIVYVKAYKCNIY